MADRSVTVRLRADIGQYQRALATASAQTTAFGRNATGASKEIDRMSGRLKLAADAALILGPALVPLGTAAVGGMVALSAQLGATAGALGVTLLAVNGLGDGLKALDAYQLEPTAANLKKLNQEMEKLGPSGEHFVRFLDSIEPQLKSLQTAARDGLLPGAEDGISSLLTMLPRLRSLISGFATELGDLSADAGKALSGDKFRPFFEYLRTDGVPILDDTARTAGNLAEVIANLFVGFGGTTRDFSSGLLAWSEGLAEASRNLDSNAGFQEFLAYIDSTGPQALDTLESIANAFLQIVEATAPLGGPVLKALESFANVVAALADSPLGTPIFAAFAALALLNRTLQVTAKLSTATFGGPAVGMIRGYVNELRGVAAAQKQVTASQINVWDRNFWTQQTTGAAANRKEMLRSAAAIGLIAVASTDYAEQAGLSNSATLALAGSLAGPWGAAIGGGIGAVLDFKGAYDGLNDSIAANDAALANNNIDQLRDQIESTKEQLKDLQNTSAGEALGHGILGGFGLGPLADAGDEIGSVTGKTGELESQLAAMQERLAGLQDGTYRAVGTLGDFAGVLGRSAAAAQEEADALRDSVDAMREKRSEALRAKNAELNYQQAIDDARKSLKENGKTVDETTEKGRNNLRNLYALADGWNQQSNAAKNATGSLKTARKGFIDTATDMGMPIQQAKRLANALFEIPPKRKTKVEADTAAALAALNEVKNFRIPDKIVQVRVQAHGATGGGGFPAAPSAEGGTVPKTGGGYADRHLYLLADGEEVVSNRHGQADRHRSLLKAINAGRMADGGTSGGLTWQSGASSSGSGIQLFIAGAWSAAKALKALKDELDRSKKALDREKQSRDDLVQASKDFASAVGGAYSSRDPFAAASGSVWGTGNNPLAIFDAAVAGNTADTQAAQSALGTAAGKGLDGALYQALAQSGNLQLLLQFANLSAAEIDAREKAFAAQSAAQSGLGASAVGPAGFTAQIKESNRHLDRIETRLHNIQQAIKDASKETGDRVAAGVNGAASNGHRRGQR